MLDFLFVVAECPMFTNFAEKVAFTVQKQGCGMFPMADVLICITEITLAAFWKLLTDFPSSLPRAGSFEGPEHRASSALQTLQFLIGKPP